MGDVKRYFMNEEGDPIPNGDGRWVLAADHLAAIAERDALLAEARGIVDRVDAANSPGRVGAAWHERRRAWLAKLEEVTRG